jgi:hypothetical protein
MLIHVNPREVAGLQYLGEKYGAKMTINPDTGLPEAFNFMRFMPMIAGAALSPFITPMGAAAVVGAVEGVRTKSLMGGLKGALGAYGGAGITSSLASFGAEGLGQQALPQLTELGTNITPLGDAATTNLGILNPGQIAESGILQGPTANEFAREMGTQGFNNLSDPGALDKIAQARGVLSEGASQLPGSGSLAAPATTGPAAVTRANLQSGIERAFTDPKAAFNAMTADPMATASRVGSALIGSQPEPEPYKPPEKKTYGSSTKAEPYKRNYRDNPNPYDTSSEFEYFQPNALYVKEGGYIGMQAGGKPPQIGMPTGLPEDYTSYMQQLQQMINLRGSPATLPGFSSPISQPKFATQATSGSKPNTYAPGGITRIQKEGQVRGDGDGMEDKVYGNIEGRQKVALSRDEFIVPADVVSGIGNGSSNAGADKLYKMMDRVRKARTGIKKQGKQIKGDRYVPA